MFESPGNHRTQTHGVITVGDHYESFSVIVDEDAHLVRGDDTQHPLGLVES